MACTICRGPLSIRFALDVLGKHRAHYEECGSCGTLQIRKPHWLDEAYSRHSDVNDPGASDRAAVVKEVVRGLDSPEGPWLDFGSGQGFLDMVQHDPRRGIHGLTQPFAGVVAIEVVEHLCDPVGELSAVSLLPAAPLLISTCLYKGQDPSWPYLAPQFGQHVTFLSDRGLRVLIERLDLRYERSVRCSNFPALELHLARAKTP